MSFAHRHEIFSLLPTGCQTVPAMNRHRRMGHRLEQYSDPRHSALFHAGPGDYALQLGFARGYFGFGELHPCAACTRALPLKSKRSSAAGWLHLARCLGLSVEALELDGESGLIGR